MTCRCNDTQPTSTEKKDTTKRVRQVPVDEQGNPKTAKGFVSGLAPRKTK